ncbi:hypothetical protein J2S20_002296 [Moryella indoligenes]|uniref:Uncharacterized protein n=1 Tax=Moryella indoligenes TaxID=371674 RepID=A0AAE3VCS0_9FIRM|nr:hypothetical protein [Moryella indoligenes]STO26886.1 Uncharacterised protein [Fusobacterium naviforme]
MTTERLIFRAWEEMTPLIIGGNLVVEISRSSKLEIDL